MTSQSNTTLCELSKNSKNQNTDTGDERKAQNTPLWPISALSLAKKSQRALCSLTLYLLLHLLFVPWQCVCVCLRESTKGIELLEGRIYTIQEQRPAENIAVRVRDPAEDAGICLSVKSLVEKATVCVFSALCFQHRLINEP